MTHVRPLDTCPLPNLVEAGLTACTACIIVLELSFDRFVIGTPKDLLQDILVSFLRAALIEELMKCLFSRLMIGNRRPRTAVEAMLLAGGVAAGYGLAEKLALGGGIIVIVNALLPLHTMFQFSTGYHLFRESEARAAGDARYGLWNALCLCVLPYILPDCAKLVLAVWLTDRIRPKLGGLTG